MISYLIRRFVQSTILALALMLGMYSLLYITPAGRFAWLSYRGDKMILPTWDITGRWRSYYCIGKPVLLRYVTWLIGDDWLGADWLYLGLGNYRYPQIDANGVQLVSNGRYTNDKVALWNNARFWTDPGPELLAPHSSIWVWGEQTGPHQYHAERIEVMPILDVTIPEEVVAFGWVVRVVGQSIKMNDIGGRLTTITVDQNTVYVFPAGEGLPRPQEGLWLNISWLTGSEGLLGSYSGYHGSYHGMLRLDFGDSWPRLSIGSR